MDIDDRVMVVSKAIQCINVKFINNPFKVKSFAGGKRQMLSSTKKLFVFNILGHVYLKLVVCISVF